MKTEFIESIESFKVSFGGKNSIDAELFAKTINNTVDLVKASADAIEPSCFLRLEIKTNQDGSFETLLDVVLKCANDLLIKENIKLACEVAVGVLAFFQIKQHLNGRKARKIETNDKETAIQNQDNQVLKVSKKIGNAYFKNNRIDNIIVNITNNLRNSDRDNFAVKASGKEVIIKKQEYENMSVLVVDENPVAKTIKQKPIEVELSLKKPDLLGDSKWQFIFNKVIEAKIEDTEFLQKVHKGKIKNLYAGVKLPCLLQIEYDLDDRSDLIPKSDRYNILQITGNIIEPNEEDNQESLFDDDK
jgi:hypothetical protein